MPKGFYKQVSSILNAARDKAYTAVNFAMVEAYWEIGKRPAVAAAKGDADGFCVQL